MRATIWISFLEYLSQEFESTISLINNKYGSISIEEVEILLICHEARLDHFRTQILTTLNIAATFSHVTSNLSTTP